jgi:leucyl/phenylalanyl-tRNA---protein transferase
MLLKAYAGGIFPMADRRDSPEVYWVEPEKRGVLPLDGFHLSRSLSKVLRSGRYETTANRAFVEVVRLCAEAAPDRASTWINDQIEAAVSLLHSAGHAHSVECWEDGQLVGGLYGISLGRAFFGESMFSRATNASKVALAHLVARLRVGGYDLLDCQFLTAHLARFGALEISKDDYKSLLASALNAADGKPAADFGAIDHSSEYCAASSPPSRTTVVSGPISGYFIAQLLAQTS